jgi:tetratricopeptide (TPR) repeat protein
MALIACSSKDRIAQRDDAIRQGDDLSAKKAYAQAAKAYEEAVAVEPRDGMVRMKLALAYEQLGRLGPATEQAVRAADLMPGNYDARLVAARLLLARGRFEDSATMSAQLQRERPNEVAPLILAGNAAARLYNSTWALYRLARTGGTGEDYERICTDLRPPGPVDRDRAAESALRKALQIEPNSIDAQLALANFLWAARRSDEAEPFLKVTADALPGHATINESLGLYYLERNQLDVGERYLKNAAGVGAPYDRTPRLELIDFYLRRNRPSDALAVLQKMGPADDEAGAVSLRTADAEIRLGHFEQAQQRIEGLLGRDAKNARALALKSQLLLQTQKPSEALSVARAAVASDAKSSDSQLVLGRALLANGDVEGGFIAFAEALRLAPGSATLPATLASLALATGRDRLALDYARQAAKRDPDDPEVAVMVVKALSRLRDFGAANFALKPLLERHAQRPDVQAQSGVLLMARGEASAARAAFERALQSDSVLFDALEGLVSIDIEQRQLPAARQRIEQALAARPNDSAILQLASRVYRVEGDLRRAETSLRRALDLEPTNVKTALLLVDCLGAQNKRDDAIRLLEGLLVRQPTSTAVQTALALQLEQTGRTSEARARYKKIITDDPGAGTAAARLALMFVENGDDLDVALAFMTDAKRLSPFDPEVSDALGWVYLHKNLALFAILHLEDATRGNPRNALFQYHLGMAYARAGRTEKARQAINLALALDSDSVNRSKAEAALASLSK